MVFMSKAVKEHHLDAFKMKIRIVTIVDQSASFVCKAVMVAITLSVSFSAVKSSLPTLMELRNISKAQTMLRKERTRLYHHQHLNILQIS